MRLPKFSFDRSEPGVWVSAGTHVVLLGLALFAVAAPALPNADEGVPVEVLTEEQFSELTRGERNAEKPQEKPNKADRVADKVEDREAENAKVDKPAPPTRPADMKVASVDEIPLRAEPSETVKEEAAAAAAKAAEAKAEAERAAAAKAEKAAEAKAAKAAEAAAKADAKAEAAKRDELQKLVEREEAEAVAKEAAAKEAAAKAKVEAKAKADAKAKAEAKADAEAKAEAKAEAEQKLAEAKAKAESDAKAKADAVAKVKAEAAARAKVKAMAEAKAKADAEAKARKQAEMAEKFNAGDIKELLANKAPSQSTGSTGREVQRTASLGTTTGNAQKLSPSLRDALVGMLQQQIERCYSAPPGAAQGVILPMLDIKLNPDGSLTSEPRILRSGQNSVDQSIAQAALRAVRRCAPYKIPTQYAPYYNDWKAINAEFEFSRV